MPPLGPPGTTSPPPNPAQVLAVLIQQVIGTAIANFGVPYSEDLTVRLGPTFFDCSGYTHYCYLNGGGVDIGANTAEQIASPLGSQISPSNGQFITASDLEPGDLVFWGNSASNLQSQHVEMYAGQNITYAGTTYTNSPTTPVMVGAYHSGTVSGPSYLPLNGNGSIAGDGVANFLTVVRYQTALMNLSGNGTNPTTNPTTPSQATNPNLPSLSSTANLSDPRNNLPFSSYFMSMRTNFMGWGGTTPLFPERHLVRGGIGQVPVSGPRPGGPFVCYFMMNPQTITLDFAIDTSQAVPPNTQTAASNSIPLTGSVQGSTLSFQLIFNRMYEVWRGDTRGPSEIGCRWDTRALERLIGLYDNIDHSNATSAYGAATPYPMPSLVQAVFGSSNSIIYTGYITDLNYEYTMFSTDMVPIECYANISLWLVYQPTGRDIINSVQHVPSDYYTPAGQGSPVVTKSGPIQGFLGAR